MLISRHWYPDTDSRTGADGAVVSAPAAAGAANPSTELMTATAARADAVSLLMPITILTCQVFEDRRSMSTHTAANGRRLHEIDGACPVASPLLARPGTVHLPLWPVRSAR